MKSNKIIICMLVLILIISALPAYGRAEYFSSNPNIRIGLIFGSSARTSFETSSPNGFIIGEVRPGGTVFYARRHIANTNISVTRRNNRLAVVNPSTGAVIYEYTRDHNLAIIAARSTQFDSRFTELTTRTTGIKTTANNNIYTGAFIYRAAANGGVEVINLVSLDDYLKGVVPSEMFPSWETEALRAFAIVARTFAVRSIRNNRHDGQAFDICNSTHCQVFTGMSRATDRTNAAVEYTSGLVITHNGNLIQALYHSSSGGATESHNDAWGGNLIYSYLTGVQLPMENYNESGRNNSRWTNSVSPQELFEYLVNESPRAALFRGNLNSAIADIRINSRSSSNRITSLTVTDNNGNSVTVNNSDAIRHAFSRFARSSNMDISRERSFSAFAATAAASSNINIEPGHTYIISASGVTTAPSYIAIASASGVSTLQPQETSDYFIFDGRGWGHGVGMSQWAAQDMALLG